MGINASNVNIYGGQVTATSNSTNVIYAKENINLSWTNPTDFIDVRSYNITPTFAKRFYDDNGNIITSGTPIGKISALDGFIVEIPSGVTIDSNNAQRIGTTNKYICAEDAELTLSVGTNVNSVKITGIKDATAENGTYKYTVTDDSTLELEGYPTIGDLNFDLTDDYYKIADVQDLKDLASYVNGGNSCEGLKFKLTVDLDLTGEDFTAMEGFNGTFNGGGKLIVTDSAIFIGNTGTISGGYYYGTRGNGFTQVFKLNLPSNVTVSGAMLFGGKYYAQNGDEVTFTADESKFIKFNAIKIGDATISGTYTVKGDTTVKVDGFPKIDGLNFNSEGEYYEIGTTDALIVLASYVNAGQRLHRINF